ncbi:MAG: hypothetical protein NC434_05775 [Ruminococcus sp.]|nr:hypothetical protein [Ruminococcus sp.]
MKNWWYYYKWYVICGIIILCIAVRLIGGALGLWEKKPDLQIAYVGSSALPQDTVSALENAFASLAGDFNGDGEVIVKVNLYTDDLPYADAESFYYEYASEVALIGDISDCESYFFLMDNPEHFQREFQLLASADGGCPEETDFSVVDKVIAWSDCSLLSTMELGSYNSMILGETQTGTNQELLSGLYLGRRCFYEENTTDNLEDCNALWNMLTAD